MNNNISIIHHPSVQKSQNTNVFHNGSSVLVRIISKKGDGKYEGSVGGVRTVFSAKNELKVGEKFTAVLKSHNGKILVIPKNKDSASGMNRLNVISFLDEGLESENPFEKVKNESALNLLKQFNLPEDNLSMHLLFQFKQLDLKFEPTILSKIRKNAVKFKGKEKKAVEILSLMTKKGFFPSDDEIFELIENLDLSLENKSEGKEFSSFQKEKLEEKNEIQFEKIVSNFFKEIIGGVNQSKIGMLTVLNQFYVKKQDNQNKRWIFLPFEIVTWKEKQKIINGNGIFKIFLVESEMNLMKIECRMTTEEFIFLMKFDKNKVVNVKFNVSEIEPAEKITEGSIMSFENENRQKNDLRIKELCEKLKSMLNDPEITVEWKERPELEGTACESEEFYLFSTEA